MKAGPNLAAFMKAGPKSDRLHEGKTLICLPL
jgi:hypothetical protein